MVGAAIYKCRLVAHDYLFFTTVGVRDTKMTNYIGNYALMYALNRGVEAIQRNAAGTKPHYREDLSKIAVYATPASPSTDRQIPLHGMVVAWENRPQVYITFNSVNTLTQLTETGRANLPQFGRKAKYPPLNSFEFFIIGANPFGERSSGVVRLGKKQVACRVYLEPLKIEGFSSGFFEPSHPVNPIDLESLSPQDIERAELVQQTPPLLVNARIRAPHYVCRDQKETYYVARPDPEKYPGVAFP